VKMVKVGELAIVKFALEVQCKYHRGTKLTVCLRGNLGSSSCKFVGLETPPFALMCDCLFGGR
jgi:hypothetical protein